MNLLFLIPIISFLGILIGIFLKKIAKEEVKFGKFGSRYFIWMERAILLIIILTVLYFTENILIAALLAIVGFVVGIFLSEYLFLGVSIVFGFLKSNEILLLLSSLVFLYGLPFGSILRNIKIKHVLLVVLFFAPFFLLLFGINQDILIGFAAGGCFNYMIKR